MRRLAASLFALTAFVQTPIPASAEDINASSDRFFRERVAPLLEKRCVQCHGGAIVKGGLSLATPQLIRKGGDSGPAVIPGKSQESPLIDAISGAPPEMPKKGDPLTPAQVADLRTWIDRGMHWPEGLTLIDRRFEGQTWWAFTPLTQPPVPAVKNPNWPRTPIDSFILSRLEAEGLTPRPEADRRTLIRRLTFDLHGVPPSPEEVNVFLNDQRPDAYEQLVDRLLDSPRYGERFGRHWLDVVHYGDTHGYDKDKRRDNAWPYRDYVIRAFNNDLPYGRFIRQQIAGDILEPNTPDGIIATGFIAAGPWDFVGHVELREGTVDKAKARLNDRDDMLTNAMSTFQSMTVHCARCHDHKFDPITQTDYYKLQAVFSGVDRGNRTYATNALDLERRAIEEKREALSERYKTLAQKIAALTSSELSGLDETIKTLGTQLAALPAPSQGSPSPTNGYHSTIQSKPDATAWVQVDLGASVPIDEIRLIPARPTDFPDTPGFGFPTHFRIELADKPEFKSSSIVDDSTRPDTPNVEDEPYSVRPAKRSSRYVRVTASRLWKRTDDYVFALAELEVISRGMNVARGKPVQSLDSIEAGRWGRAALVDGFDSRAQRPADSDANATRRADLLYQVRQTERARTKAAEALIPPALRTERESNVAERKILEEKLKTLQPTEVVYSVVPHAPRPIEILKRGDVEQPGAPVKPGALACVPGLDSEFTLANPDFEGTRRAALADWLSSPKNMLTWRSIANRVWQFHFGRGIVDTPNDFGRNGSKPTHPELLDWLAYEFREKGQSLKALHRSIVRSAVYRQSSQGDPAGETKDADNRWLWRQNRRRLDAESIRDSVLAVTGSLDNTMGGPGFDLFRFKDDHSPIYDHTSPGVADNPRVRRRTVYRFTVRSVPNPFLECLDCADPNINTPVRSTTITALQALALLNDPFIVSQANEFAKTLENQKLDARRQIDTAYECALGRPPRPEEQKTLRSYAEKHGLAAACRILLNTNEFMFVD